VKSACVGILSIIGTKCLCSPTNTLVRAPDDGHRPKHTGTF